MRIAILTDIHANREAFLASLPMADDQGDALFVHASANAPQDCIYVTDTGSAMPSFRVCGARVILVGHHHVPALPFPVRADNAGGWGGDGAAAFEDQSVGPVPKRRRP